MTELVNQFRIYRCLSAHCGETIFPRFRRGHFDIQRVSHNLYIHEGLGLWPPQQPVPWWRHGTLRSWALVQPDRLKHWVEGSIGKALHFNPNDVNRGCLVFPEGFIDSVLLPLHSNRAKPDFHSCRNSPHEHGEVLSSHRSRVIDLEFRSGVCGVVGGRILDENHGLSGRICQVCPGGSHIVVYYSRLCVL